jgi:hypothetical protein
MLLLGHVERMGGLKYASTILFGKAEGRQVCRHRLSERVIIRVYVVIGFSWLGIGSSADRLYCIQNNVPYYSIKTFEAVISLDRQM